MSTAASWNNETAMCAACIETFSPEQCWEKNFLVISLLKLATARYESTAQ